MIACVGGYVATCAVVRGDRESNKAIISGHFVSSRGTAEHCGRDKKKSGKLAHLIPSAVFVRSPAWSYLLDERAPLSPRTHDTLHSRQSALPAELPNVH